MSLPIVIIFERHWDPIPKTLIKGALPDLAKQGYGTLCYEFSQDLTSDEIIKKHEAGLAFDLGIQQDAEKFLKQVRITRNLSDMSFRDLAELMRLYVFSQKYEIVAERIKQLPASLILKELFKEAATLSLVIEGIDICSSDYDKMVAPGLSTRMVNIEANEDKRITTFFENLLKLRAQKEEGIIFTCGALHAKRLLDKFKEHNMQNEVLYYFPHSSKRYDDSFDDVNDIAMNETLVGHTHLLEAHEVKVFGSKIIHEIRGKIKYKKEIPENSHSQFLTQCLKANFRAFLRPGYYVDALVDLHEASDIGNIRQRICEVGIQPYDISLSDRRFMVVPGVNTGETAERMRKIKMTL